MAALTSADGIALPDGTQIWFDQVSRCVVCSDPPTGTRETRAQWEKGSGACWWRMQPDRRSWLRRDVANGTLMELPAVSAPPSLSAAPPRWRRLPPGPLQFESLKDGAGAWTPLDIASLQPLMQPGGVLDPVADIRRGSTSYEKVFAMAARGML